MMILEMFSPDSFSILFPVLMSFLGACLGSFTTMLIYRLHHDEPGIIKGRSKCPKCNHQLTPRELVPIFSWLFQRGKCAACHEKIPARYPMIEILFAFVFCIFTQKFLPENPLSVSNFSTLFFILSTVFLFLVLFFYDLFYMEVDERIVLPSILLLTIYAFFRDLDFSVYLIGGLVGFAFYAVQYFGSKGVWVGAGDMRLGAILGLVLGWKLLLMCLFLAYIIGATVAIGLMVSKKANRKTALPMGAFLMPSGLIFLYAGNDIWNWYWNMNGLALFLI